MVATKSFATYNSRIASDRHEQLLAGVTSEAVSSRTKTSAQFCYLYEPAQVRSD